MLSEGGHTGIGAFAAPAIGGKGAYLRFVLYALDNDWVEAWGETSIGSTNNRWDIGAVADAYLNGVRQAVGPATYIYNTTGPRTVIDKSAFRTACWNDFNYSGTTYLAEARTRHFWLRRSNGRDFTDTYGVSRSFSCA